MILLEVPARAALHGCNQGLVVMSGSLIHIARVAVLSIYFTAHYTASLQPLISMLQQVTTCEQLQAYLTKFVTSETAAAAPSAAVTVDVPEGFKAMKKKGDDDELDGASF